MNCMEDPKPHLPTLIILGIAALVALAVGISATFAPIAFAASNGSDLAGDTNALSEMRSAGGAILIAAALMLAGLWRPGLRRLAMTVTAILYVGYGAGRAFSVVADGVPHRFLVAALAVELIVGIAATWALVATQSPTSYAPWVRWKRYTEPSPRSEVSSSSAVRDSSNSCGSGKSASQRLSR